VWEGKTLGQICAQIKDPARNGGRTLEALVDHIGTDHLVGWAWAPGFGRRPTPGTQKEAGALAEAWVKPGGGASELDILRESALPQKRPTTVLGPHVAMSQ
jgi:hypothetical protein